MTRIWAEQALTAEGWQSAVLVNLDADGRISSVAANAPKVADHLVPILLPAPVNAHSHAFQRAMAGLTERRGPQAHDSFWTWRKLMFRFLERLTPDHVQAIAAFVQMEMLEAGYATNVEFHYLHHQPDGHPYANPAEMSLRIAAAAGDSGIGLTLLPVHYQFGGCDRRALTEGQRRFGTTPDQFAQLYDAAAQGVSGLPGDACMGVAPHSLRAVAPEGLPDLRALTSGPMHMHLAEQQAEVDEILAAYGQRPVEWVLHHMDPDPGMTFIHCTQMLPHETLGLAQSGAVAGLCPITESSLGDGIFDGVRFLQAGGRIAVGSDSNIRISLSEELRTLDYSQRLRDRSRAALASTTRSTGRRVFEAALEGGALAAGRETGQIAPGQFADLLSLDGDHIDLRGLTGDTVLDSFIFAGDDRMIRNVWTAGRHMVQDGTHVARPAIEAAYARAIASLRQDL